MQALEYRKLDESEVQHALAEIPNWTVSEGQLSRELEFGTYKDGVVFASALAYLADALDHHPDLYIGYGKVRVTMHTHSVGGLSPYDFELARRIEALL